MTILNPYRSRIASFNLVDNPYYSTYKENEAELYSINFVDYTK